MSRFLLSSLETETFVQTNLKPIHKVSVAMAVAAQQKTPAGPEKQAQPQPHTEPHAPPPAQVHLQQQEEEKLKAAAAKQRGLEGMSPAILTTLLLIPLVLVISIGVFIRWRKTRMYTGEETNLPGGGDVLPQFLRSWKTWTGHGKCIPLQVFSRLGKVMEK